jgi:predicted amidohydrolase
MRIAALQMVARSGDVAANLATIADAAAEAKSRGADLLVAPELALTGYGGGVAIRALAEPANGELIAALDRLAASSRIALVAGFPERADDRIYNSAAFLGPAGERCIYRKRRLYGAYEHDLFSAGRDAMTICNIAGVEVGILICYDVEFPECVRPLALAGAQLLAVPTALPAGEYAKIIAEKMVPVRAFENQIAIAYANHAGRDEHLEYAGRSCIVMPDGTDAARAGPAESALLVADYDPARFSHSRRENPYLAALAN